jgi:[acyl-carrier-protein] S-malonyltransferase
MLRDHYDNSDKIKQIMNDADKILDYKISEICFNGPVERLQETRYTQPALFLHSISIYELIKRKQGFDAIAGHSVGEYAALYIAGVISFKDALRLVSLRGELMFATGNDVPGTMFAVINIPDEKVIEICKKYTDDSKQLYFVPANFNCPGQVVVSGNRDYLRENINIFKEEGARLIKELQVSGAFHSPLMTPSKEKLSERINSITFYDAVVPVYLNVTGKPTQDKNEIKKYLIEQLISPVL